MGVSIAKAHKFDDRHKVAENYMDKLFELYPFPASFNISDIINKSSLAANEKSEAHDLYYEIRELLTERFEYAKDHHQLQSNIYLTDKGREAKDIGGHFAYEKHKKQQKENFSLNNTTTIMRDQYIIQQAAAVGPNAIASNNNFNQIYTLPDNIDFDELINELQILKQALLAKATLPEHYVLIGEVIKAEDASKNKDGNSMVKHLLSAGKWVLDTAKEVGTNVLAEIIVRQIC